MEEKDYKQLFDEIKQIASRQDFSSYCNTRDFELEITEMSKNIIINKNDNEFLTQELEKLLKTNLNSAFCLFFVMFTKYRRNKYGNLIQFVEKYNDEFFEYKISEFIYILAQFSENHDEKAYFRILKKTDNLIKSKGENYDFSNHSGILNLYVEIVCSYFESQLDDRNEEEMTIYLKKANTIVDDMIVSCKNDKVYPKYYLNKGRILVLLKKYKEGEKYIAMGIRSIELGPDRERTIRDYEQYLQKSNLIKSYDMTTDKIKELDSVKVNNTKALALMTSLLGFLLGSINIFSQINDVFSLAMLMLSYVGLLLILTAVIFIGLNLTFKEKRKNFIIYDLIILCLGIIIFASTVITVLNHK